MPIKSILSADQCREKCREESKCEYFVLAIEATSEIIAWGGQKGDCWLKNGFERSEPYQGLTGGFRCGECLG